MELKEIMTSEEQQAAVELIKARLIREKAKHDLWRAEDNYKRVSSELTNLYFRRGDDKERAGTIPEQFVAYFEGRPFLITMDTEGDGENTVSLIGGVLLPA